MKRFWLGLGILAVILAAGIVTMELLCGSHTPISRDLEAAAQAAQREDWQQAAALAGKAQTRWQQRWRLTAALMDHAPMSEIDGMFAELEVYAGQRDTEDYAAVCAHLSRLTKAICEENDFSWWNLL